MYKIGMYGGSFNPLHLGHVNNILTASSLCDKLYLVLSVTKDPKEIDHRERLMWLKNITKDLDNIEIFEIFDKNISKKSYDWNSGVKDINKYIGDKIDVVFCGDDYKGKNLWEKLYPESEIYYFSRNSINISSTEIRSNPYKYYEYLPNVVRPYFVKKVCVLGTESCGKTQLVRKLALYFNTTHVEKAGRYVCAEAGGIDNMKTYHYLNILTKHKELENKALKNANKVLIIDTDSLITLYYYRLGFENNESFEKIATGLSELNNIDLYIFLEPTVKWVQDGTRTYGTDEIRNENNIKLKQILDDNNIKYVSISGNYLDRYEKSKKLINELINK